VLAAIEVNLKGIPPSAFDGFKFENFQTDYFSLSLPYLDASKHPLLSNIHQNIHMYVKGG
jgi:hypothetical protein